MKIRTFILIFIIVVVNIEEMLASQYLVNGQVINDITAARLITVINSTSPIKSMPSLKHIYSSQSSLFKNPTLARCKKIISFDGMRPEFEQRRNDYAIYKGLIQAMTYTDPYFRNVELVFCKEWGHLTGTVKAAIEKVTTPFVFLFQHDDILQKDFDLNGCIASMLKNPKIKYIHLTRGFNFENACWFDPLDTHVEGGSLIPLTRAFGWSDYAHVATVDYYKNFILPQCGHHFMEVFISHKFRAEIENKTMEEMEKIHSKYGSYLYGNIEDGNYIFHTDGRNQ